MNNRDTIINERGIIRNYLTRGTPMDDFVKRKWIQTHLLNPNPLEFGIPPIRAVVLAIYRDWV